MSIRQGTWRDHSGRWSADLRRHELRCDGAVVPLGDRAFAVLACMIQAGDRVVSKDELLEHVWPGVVVEENTLQTHVLAIRRALGDGRAGLQTVFGRGYRMAPQWLPGPGPPGPRPKPLPLPATHLIGRDATITSVVSLLGAHRVVTLTGTGGIGKTALALAAARSFGMEAAFVELAMLSDATLLPAAAAHALGLKLRPEAIDTPRLLRAIGGARILLLIDNCEHLVEAVAVLVEEVITKCAHVTVLATSRETLRVTGEAVYRVPPLDVPLKGAADMLAHGAVQLLLARMGSLDAAVQHEEMEVAAAAEICRRLDGIPLAIEFAAAHAAALGLRQVAAHLTDRLDLLGGGRRTALPRQQTLRAAFDWSYDLLNPAEQAVLCSLSVFAGSFTLQAAIAVAGGVDATQVAVVECVANLVAKSLVSAVSETSDRRFRLLEITCSFALAKSVETGEHAAAERRHAEYYRDLFSSVAETSTHADPSATYAADIANVRVALDWALFSGGDAATGIALATSLTPLWVRMSMMAEATRYVRQALTLLDARGDADPHTEMVLNAALGASLTYTVGPGPQILAAWSKTLRLAQELSDTEYILRALRGLWSYHMNRAEYRAALALANRFCTLAGRQADAVTLRAGNRMAGLILHYLGDQKEARARIECGDAGSPAPQPLPMTRFMLNDSVAARALLARISWLQGFPVGAMREANDAVLQAQLSGHALSQCHALAQAACPVALWTGDLDAMHRSVTMLNELASLNALDGWIARGKCFYGVLLIMRGELDEGTTILQPALEELRVLGSMAEYPAFQGALSRALALAGNVPEGMGTIDQALRHSENIGESWCYPELLRTRGEILALGNAPDVAGAEESFRRSLDVARRTGAVSWELRSAAALTRLRWETGGRDPVRMAHPRGLLADVYGKFSEGFETADLREAKELLERIA